MLAIRRIHLGEAELYKALRLAALQEAPHAFTSTYPMAVGRTDESWQKQADEAAKGRDRAIFLAFIDETAVGLAALYRASEDRLTGEMLQVWVAPQLRRQRVARGITDEVIRWARSSGFERVIAVVTPKNEAASALYFACGFIRVSTESTGPPGEAMFELSLIPPRETAPS
jgi:ribosomal protein S18 acetylase RimI-like enzyme